MASKIQAAVAALCDLSFATSAPRIEVHKDCLNAINKLGDDDWEKLPPEAQKWANDCADEIEKKGRDKAKLPEFPDYTEDKEEAAPRRRKAAEADAEPAPIKVGMEVTITTQRGKEYTGTLVERDKDGAVLKVGDEELEFGDAQIKTIAVFNDGAGKGSTEPEEPEIGVGVQVKLVTSRGREVEGEIVEINDKEVVLKTAEGEEDFLQERVKSITPLGGGKGKPAAKEETASGRRRAAASDDADAGKGKDEKEERTRTSSKENGGVSVGLRIREMILDNLDWKVEDVEKALKKEGLAFRENTLALNYNETHKLVKMMKDRKMLR